MLAADLSHYHTDYLWKLPGSWEGYPYYTSPEFYEDIARMASRGVMDMLFFGDSGGTPEDYGGNHQHYPSYDLLDRRIHLMAPTCTAQTTVLANIYRCVTGLRDELSLFILTCLDG